MKRILLLILGIIFISTTNALPENYWEFVSGLKGGSIANFYFNSKGQIYALTKSKYFFKSTDNGESWQKITRLYEKFSFLNIFQDSLFIINSPAGLKISSDEGRTWTDFGLPKRKVYSIAILDDNTIYAGTDVGIWATFDAGKSWVPLGFTTEIISSMKFVPDSVIFVSINNNSAARFTTDRGKTWTDFASPGNILDYFISPKGYFYIVYYEKNGSAYFSKFYRNEEIWKMNIYSSVKNLTFINDSTALVLFDFSGILFVLNDNTGELQQIETNIKQSILCLEVGKNGEIFAGVQNEGVFVSNDGGLSWIQRSQGIDVCNIYSIKVDSKGYVYVNKGNWVRSKDKGNNWEEFSLSKEGNDFFFDNQDRIWVVDNNGVFRSTDNGANWENLTQGFNSPKVQFLKILRDSIVVIGLEYFRADTNLDYKVFDVFLSTDDGRSWQKTPPFQLSTSNQVAIDSKSNLYLGELSLNKSTDFGKSWTNYQINDIVRILQILTDKYDNVILYVLPNKVMVSQDGGKTFSNVPAPTSGDDFISLYYEPSSETLFLLSNYGVYYSHFDYQNWKPLNEGMECIGVTAFAVDKDGYLYAGTGGCGLYKSKYPAYYLSTEDYSSKSKGGIIFDPNKNDSEAWLSFNLEKGGIVEVSVWNIFGVKVLFKNLGYLAEGNHSIPIEKRNLANGVYIVSIITNKVLETTFPFLLIK